MRTVLLLPALALALAPLSPGANAEPLPAQEILSAQPPELVARLLEEKVVLLREFGEVHDAPRGHVHAFVLFERPLDAVLGQLIQCERQGEYRPELRDVRLIEEADDGPIYQYELRWMLMRVVYRLRHHWNLERAQVWWDLDPRFDNDFAALEGRWELFPFGAERTLARFGSLLDLGPGLPDFLEEFATRTKLPEAMQGVRRWIDSGGTYRP